MLGRPVSYSPSSAIRQSTFLIVPFDTPYVHTLARHENTNLSDNSCVKARARACWAQKMTVSREFNSLALKIRERGGEAVGLGREEIGEDGPA